MTLAQIRDRYEPVWHGASWREIPPPPPMGVEAQPAALRAAMAPTKPPQVHRRQTSALGAVRALLEARALAVPELMEATGFTKYRVNLCLQYFRRTRQLKSVAWTQVPACGRPYRQYRIGR